MRILVDTNVILDLLLDREPFSTQAGILISQIEKGKLTGLLCATTITTIYYLITKSLSKREADKSLDLLFSLFEIAPVNRIVLETAKNLKFKDFEDAVIYSSAIHSNVDVVITRNIRDFKMNEIPIYEPVEFLKILKIKEL
ncbi:PIN domain-containing protein [Persephonella atlantica]|uniref:PIN domain-containing protein n=1 Tax=Persephonella atlantica TaxID=2699429 RepID=A0ABS1GJ50_9AQUI|nr:PIN domain-containing protein [Persephonella atlantica]MBK3332935.1 PIN domain-containing protein [Persephonella atlantica]